LQAIDETDDVVGLLAGEPQRLGVLAVLELERDDAHADEVRAVDALEALGEDGPHAEQARALRGPVARRARAVLLARDDEERNTLGLVLHRGLVNRHLLAIREVPRDTTLGAGRETIAQTHVGEGAAHHDLVVAAPRAVGVEVLRLNALLNEVLAGGAVL